MGHLTNIMKLTSANFQEGHDGFVSRLRVAHERIGNLIKAKELKSACDKSGLNSANYVMLYKWGKLPSEGDLFKYDFETYTTHSINAKLVAMVLNDKELQGFITAEALYRKCYAIVLEKLKSLAATRELSKTLASNPEVKQQAYQWAGGYRKTAPKYTVMLAILKYLADGSAVRVPETASSGHHLRG